MNLFTTRELKALNVGDDIWLVDAWGQKRWKVYSNEDYYLIVLKRGNRIEGYQYFDYGKTWLAYKSKEQSLQRLNANK